MKMRFKSESAAIKYYRERGWNYSGGRKSNSRSGGLVNLTKPSRVPDEDSVFGGYMEHFLTIENEGYFWSAKFEYANRYYNDYE